MPDEKQLAGPPPAASPEESPSAWASVSELLKFVGVGAALLTWIFVAFVWPNLRGNTTQRSWIAAGSLGMLALLVVFALSLRIRIFETARDFLVVQLVTLTVAIAPFYFTGADTAVLLKVAAIAYFGSLPATLYLQFLSTRGQTLWDEYVTDLYRLRIDHPAHLPEPPRSSVFHAQWAVEDGRWAEGTPRESKQKAPNDITVYQRKFEALYGPVRGGTQVGAKNLFPVLMATLIIAVGWAIVAEPQSILGYSVIPRATLTGHPVLPVEMLRFGFLGAYFYVLQMLIRRYFQNDLKPHAYVHTTMRCIVVWLLVWVLSLVWTDPATAPHRAAAAFVVGVFPQVGLQALIQAIKLPLGALVPSLKPHYPLSNLDGLNVWYESRLLEEGIEDMQNLATCNLVDAMLNTRIPVERLVDWVDQALLYLHLRDDEGEREALRKYGIRTATDLEGAFAGTIDDPERRKVIAAMLEPEAAHPARVASILSSLGNDPNLVHVREWKRFSTAIVEGSMVSLRQESRSVARATA